MEPEPKDLKPEDTQAEEETELQWIRYEDLAESDIDDEYGDMVIVPKLLVNNEDALERINEDISLKGLDWGETLVVTSKESLEVEDVFDDLKREEAFFNQALEAAYTARDLAEKEGLTFFKPENFIAPMIKNDAQLEAIRQKLIAEAQDGDEDAIRRLNIFNKEQKKAKMNERAKLLARKKREGTEVTLEDEFNLDLDEAERLAAATGDKSADGRPAKNYDRESKNAKYSLGKRSRTDNNNNAANPAKKGMSLQKKSSLKRPGKNKRQMMRGKN